MNNFLNIKNPIIDRNNNNLNTPCIEHEHSATSLFSIISEAKPAEIIVNDCGEVAVLIKMIFDLKKKIIFY
jgi:hypothetical protein